jgi:hypothetical protein
MQFDPHQDPQEVRQWLFDLADKAPVDEVMVFFFAEELNTGHEPIEGARFWIERTRPWRQALRERGIAVSLNIWQTVLHRDNARRLHPGQDWQTMVGQHGEQAAAVVCPLDPGWRAYYRELLGLFCQEGFRVVWVEDDFRLHNHRPLTWGGCFCPLHVAEFNRRAGLTATREEIVRNCTAPGDPHPWRELWLDMWDDTQRDVVSSWREIVERTGSRLGLMSSRMQSHAAEGRDWAKWWQALAGDNLPIHRPGYWSYSDTLGSSLPDSIAVFQQDRSVEPEGTEVGPEIENFTYGRWHKSFRQTGAQMALGHVLGATSLNVSLYDFMGNRPDDEPERANFLRRWRPVCDWLADRLPMTLRSVGVGIPWSQDMGRRIHTDGSGDWRSLECPHRQWASWLGALGQAFAMGAAPEVNALAGPVLWSFSDEELRDWLSRGVLMDATAAEILIARGLSELIGERAGRWVAQSEVLYSFERSTDPAFSLRVGASMSVNLLPRVWQADLLPGARLASELRGPTHDVVGPGLHLFENPLGGRVAILPWAVQDRVTMTIQRWGQLTKTLDWLSRGRSLGRVEGGPWLVSQFLTDGKLWRGAIWNADADDISEFTLRLPADMPALTSATHITAGGELLPAEVDGPRVRVPRPLQQWELVVVR